MTVSARITFGTQSGTATLDDSELSGISIEWDERAPLLVKRMLNEQVAGALAETHFPMLPWSKVTGATADDSLNAHALAQRLNLLWYFANVRNIPVSIRGQGFAMKLTPPRFDEPHIEAPAERDVVLSDDDGLRLN